MSNKRESFVFSFLYFNKILKLIHDKFFFQNMVMAMAIMPMQGMVVEEEEVDREQGTCF